MLLFSFLLFIIYLITAIILFIELLYCILWRLLKISVTNCNADLRGWWTFSKKTITLQRPTSNWIIWSLDLLLILFKRNIIFLTNLICIIVCSYLNLDLWRLILIIFIECVTICSSRTDQHIIQNVRLLSWMSYCRLNFNSTALILFILYYINQTVLIFFYITLIFIIIELFLISLFLTS